MPLLNQLKGDIMSYKNIKHDFSFADFAIQSFADKNRTLLFLLQVGNTIDWQPIQELLIKYYERGKSLSSLCSYSNVSFSKNGIKSSPIQNLKAKLMTGFLLNPFLISRWKFPLRIILLFQDSGTAFPKNP